MGDKERQQRPEIDTPFDRLRANGRFAQGERPFVQGERPFAQARPRTVHIVVALSSGSLGSTSVKTLPVPSLLLTSICPP